MLSKPDIFFSLHAVQTGCITLESLIRAVRSRPDLSTRTLYEVLVEDKWIDAESGQMLRHLVERHVADQSSDRLLSDSSDMRHILMQLEKLDIPDLTVSIATMIQSEKRGTVGQEATELHTPQSDLTAAEARRTPRGTSRFRVIRLHAKGGLGEVFVARDEELGRDVALKEIQGRYAFHPESRNRFLLEAEVTSSLEHPGIVPVYGMGQYADGRPYYAMRFVRGDSLKEAIDRFHQYKPLNYGSIEFRQLLGRFIDVCQAIGYAHSRGVLHRDLKPGNIMLGEHGETLVVDWGLARCAKEDTSPRQAATSVSTAADLSATPTMMGTVIGTPAFMPPEQARGEIDKLGPASDVYSLGATLYQILTGKPPFAEVDRDSLLSSVIAGNLPTPRTIQRTIPKPLEAVCLKAMALTPQSRYQMPQELAEEIEKYLADESVAAFREPLHTHAIRWIRKHPAHVATAVATVVLGLFSSGILAYVNGRHARDLQIINQDLTLAKNEAEREKLQAEGVTDFLVESFRKLDPEQDGRDVKAFEILERAREKLAEPSDMGLIQRADITQAIGLSYLELEASDEAIALFEECLKVRTDQLGPHHHETLTTMGTLGLAHLTAGSFETALKLLVETEQLMKIHVGANHEDTLNAMINLANCYSQCGEQTKAIAKYEEAFELMKEHLGMEHETTLTTMGGLAFAYETLGNFEKGVPLMEKAFDLTRDKLGENHSSTLLAMNNLALSYNEMGKVQQAIDLYEDALERVRTKYGEEHLETISSISNLAEAYRMNEQHDLSIPMAEKAWELSKIKQGEEHPSTITSMGMLATSYFSAGELDKAEPLFKETLRLRRSKLGENHPSTITSFNNLGRLYQSQNKFDEALKVFRELVPLATSNLGADHILTLTSMNNLAVSLRETKNYEESIPMFLKTLESMKEILGEDNISTYTCAHNLAATYQGAGKSKEAIEMEDRAFTGMIGLLGDTHPTVQKVGQAYAKMLLDAGEAEKGAETLEAIITAQRNLAIENDLDLAELLENSSILLIKVDSLVIAEKYAKESVAIHRGAKTNQWNTYHSLSILGSCFLRQKKFSEAEPLLLRACEGFESAPGADSSEIRSSVISCMKLLVELYSSIEDTEEANKWQMKLEDYQKS